MENETLGGSKMRRKYGLGIAVIALLGIGSIVLAQPGPPPGGPFPGGPGPRFRPTMGTITSIQGNRLQVKPFGEGNPIVVIISSDTDLFRAETVPLSGLKPGEKVVLIGRESEDGTGPFQAFRIQAGEPGRGPRPGGGFIQRLEGVVKSTNPLVVTVDGKDRQVNYLGDSVDRRVNLQPSQLKIGDWVTVVGEQGAEGINARFVRVGIPAELGRVPGQVVSVEGNILTVQVRFPEERQVKVNLEKANLYHFEQQEPSQLKEGDKVRVVVRPTNQERQLAILIFTGEVEGLDQELNMLFRGGPRMMRPGMGGPGGPPAGPPEGQGPGGPGGPGPGRRPQVLQGEIASTDPLTLKAEGKTITLQLSGQTRILKGTKAAISDLKAGEFVFVKGDPNPDGSITGKVVVTGLPAPPQRGGGGGQRQRREQPFRSPSPDGSSA